MKVLIVSFLLDPRLGGGGATAALHLCRGLARQSIEVVAVTTHNESQPRTIYEDGLKVHAFRPRNLYWIAEKDRQPLVKKVIWQLIDTWNPQVYHYLSDVIRDEKPDIVHVNKLRGLSPAVWAAAAKNNRPIVQSCHDYELISPEGSLESTVGRLALKRHWALRPYQSLRSHWSNHVNVVTAPSRYTLQTITDLGFFSRSHQFVVPNSHGFSESELPQLMSLADASYNAHHTNKFNLLYLGRLESIKGIDVLCEAFAGIAADQPHVQLDIAGSGSRENALRAEYAAIPQIVFHGYVAGKVKDSLIAGADVLIMPSIYREIFGISIIEAYAYGKPVIAACAGGMPELVREGQTGLLVEPGDVAGLRDVIRQIAIAPGLARAMSPACRETARSYTLEAVTKAYLDVYETARQ